VLNNNYNLDFWGKFCLFRLVERVDERLFSQEIFIRLSKTLPRDDIIQLVKLFN